MISWVREKVAERRARWSRIRKQDDDSTEKSSTEKQNSFETKISTTSCEPCSGSGEQKNTTETTDNTRCSTTLDEVNVRVFTSRGKSVSIKIKCTATGFELKTEAFNKLSEIPNALPSNANNIEILKIIQAKNKRKLDENLTLNDLHVQENDEFILTFKRTTLPLNPEELHGPSLSQVMIATKDVQSTRISSPPIVNIDDLVFQNDLQFDIRKILISLAQSSAYIIGGGIYAERLITMLKLRLLNRRKHEADTIQCLVEMGFCKERVIYALKLKNDVYSAALDWLIENQSTTSLVGYVHSSDLSTKFNNLNSCKDNIEALLEIIRIHAHRNIPPSTEMVKTIVEMGFIEEEVIDALKATRNNQAAACEWLVGIRTKSLTELRDGLPTESPVLKALLSSPQVQISLGNPKMFIAYISMLENYSAMSMWLGDNDTSAILGHILRTYHEEKHIVAINQFSSML